MLQGFEGWVMFGFHVTLWGAPPFSKTNNSHLKMDGFFRQHVFFGWASFSGASIWIVSARVIQNISSGGGLKKKIHPYLWKIPIWTNIVQMGWNHQLVSVSHNSTRQSSTCRCHTAQKVGFFPFIAGQIFAGQIVATDHVSTDPITLSEHIAPWDSYIY